MYRAKNAKSGMYVQKVESPKTRHPGDVSAYWKYVWKPEQATTFTSYADAEMPGIMLRQNIIVVDLADETVVREMAMANGTFHSHR